MGIFNEVLAIASTGISIAVCFVNVVGYPAFVDGVSMRPVFYTLRIYWRNYLIQFAPFILQVLNPNDGDKDCVFLNRWAAKDFKVQRGNIICLKSPRSPSSSILIKRVIGIEGDIVKTLSYHTPFVKVPKGHCWVEGENHSQSMDSNFFGPVPLGLIEAKVSYIIWPPRRFTKLTSEILPGREVYWCMWCKTRAARS